MSRRYPAVTARSDAAVEGCWVRGRPDRTGPLGSSQALEGWALGSPVSACEGPSSLLTSPLCSPADLTWTPVTLRNHVFTEMLGF